MARNDRKQGAGTPGIDLAGRKPAPPGAVLLLTVSFLAALWAAALLTQGGRLAYAYVFFFVEFFGGVFALVGLTLTVMIGLLATDRLVLQPRQRVWVQSAHRTLGVFSVAWLVFHVLSKVSEGRATVLEAAVPFLGGTVNGQSVLYMGMGPLAAYMMLSVLWTGLIRRRFAGNGKPWMWRALHSVAYLAWPVALLHGLGAGRPPATWVTLSYLACVLAVAVALMLRLSVGRRRGGLGGRLATTTMSTGSIAMRPVGRTSSASTPAVARRRGAAPAADPLPDYDEDRYDEDRDDRFDTRFVAADLERDEPVRELMLEPIREPVREPVRAGRSLPPVREPVREPIREPIRESRRAGRLEPAAMEQVAASDPWTEPVRSRTETPRTEPRRTEAPWNEAPRTEPPRAERAGRRRAIEPSPADLRTGDLRERPGRHADDYATERPIERPVEPPRRRARSADEYLVTEPPRERVEPSAMPVAEPVGDAEPRYRARATAPAPRYIPAPAPEVDGLIVDDVPAPEFDLIPPDDTPTLVDLASRRAIRDASRDRDAVRERDAAREAATKSRRAKRRKVSEKDDVDEEYWGYLRGEAK